MSDRAELTPEQLIAEAAINDPAFRNSPFGQGGLFQVPQPTPLFDLPMDRAGELGFFDIPEPLVHGRPLPPGEKISPLVITLNPAEAASFGWPIGQNEYGLKILIPRGPMIQLPVKLAAHWYLAAQIKPSAHSPSV